MAEEKIVTDIQKITDEKIAKIKNSSAYGLPDRPSERGMSPAEIKQAFYAPLVSASDSICGEINRIVADVNNVNTSLVRKINDNESLIEENKMAQDEKNTELSGLISTNTEDIAKNKSAQDEKNTELSGLISTNTEDIAKNKSDQDTKNKELENRISKSEKQISEGSGQTLGVTMDPDTYVMRIVLYNALKEEISSASVDLPLESLVSSGSVSDDGDTLTLTLTTGQRIEVDVTKIVRGLTTDEGLESAIKSLETELRNELVPKMSVIDQNRIKAYEDNGEYYFSENNWKAFIGDEASGKFGYNRAYVERSKARGAYGMYALSSDANPIYNAWLSKAEWAERFAREHPGEDFREPNDNEYPLLDSIAQRGKDGAIFVPLVPKDNKEAVSLYHFTTMKQGLEKQLEDIKTQYESMRNDVYAGTAGLAYELSADGTYYICTGLGIVPEGSNIKIAGYIKGLPVLEVGESAFSGKTLAGVQIPETIIRFRNNAFGWAGKTGAVYIKDLAKWCVTTFETSSTPVTYANPKVYIKDIYLTELVIPDGVKKINQRAFMHWAQFTDLVLPGTIETLDNMAFQYCQGFKSVKIPESMQTMGASSFGYCTALKTVIFEGTPNFISSTAFERDTALTDIYVPWEEGAVGNAPWGATNAKVHYLSKATAGLGYTLSDDGTFYICSGIGTSTYRDIVIASAIGGIPVRRIADYAFEGVTRITSVWVPDGIEIGAGAFNNCYSLKIAYIGSCELSYSCFEGCKALTDIYINVYEDALYGSPWGAVNANVHWLEIPSTIPMVVYVNGYHYPEVTTDTGLTVTVQAKSNEYGFRSFEQDEMNEVAYISGYNMSIYKSENADVELLEEKDVTGAQDPYTVIFRRYKITVTQKPAKIYTFGYD